MTDVFTAHGQERFLNKDDVIVSKTNTKGHITYVNKTFIDISDYSEEELLGAPHSILRHPGMPRAVFKLLWDTINNGEEIFAYVINKTKYNDYYWVFAHVTPSYSLNGELIGYHSSRRAPDMTIVNTVIKPLYASLLREEQRHANQKEGMAASYNALLALLAEKEITYDKLILTL